MQMQKFWRHIRPEALNLSLKSQTIAVLACFSTILLLAWTTQHCIPSASYPLLVASMGASAAIVFITPSSPLAQPWPLVGGHLISATTGVLCNQLLSDKILACACAVGISVLLMLLFRCLHPPGAATALTPILSNPGVHSHTFEFIAFPVGINVVVLLLSVLFINRILLGLDYPSAFFKRKPASNNSPERIVTSNINNQDLEQALGSLDVFLDVSTEDLEKVLNAAQLQTFKRHYRPLTCADIMLKEVASLDYDTEVESAWKTMHQQQLKAMPVLDRNRRVIGMLTWADFLKFVNTDTQESFASKLRAFIRRTPDISTHKPEAVGHIMSHNISLLKQTAHIEALIPLMTTAGYRQIPIVDHENRLVGMVYQAHLIAALYYDLVKGLRN